MNQFMPQGLSKRLRYAIFVREWFPHRIGSIIAPSFTNTILDGESAESPLAPSNILVDAAELLASP